MTRDDIVRAHDDFADHQLFAEECLSVREKGGQIIPYRFAASQAKFWLSIKRQRDGGKPVRQCWLKSRQVYGSTTVAGYFFHRLAFHTGQHARVIAHEADAAGDIFDYYRTFDQYYQPFRGLVAKSPLRSDAQRWLKWSNDAWARILTAGNLRTGRSATVQLWHCSEMSLWPNATALFRGIQGSVPDRADTAVIVESTANGVGDEFHQLCLLAMGGSSEWAFVFFGWHEHPEYERDLPLEASQFQGSLSRDERALMERFGLTLRQMAWRRWKIETGFHGDADGFRQEFPAEPEEAFISSGRPRFSLVELRSQPVVDGAPVGELEDVQIASERRIRFRANEGGALTIYRKPEQGRLYAIGADTSEGLDANEGVGSYDPDYSVACVLDVQSGEQVAKFRARVHPAELGRYLVSLGAYYHWAYLVPEVNKDGIATLTEIQRLLYPSELIYRRPSTQADRVEKAAGAHHLYGYKTTPVTRPQLVNALDNAIYEGAITIRDPHTLRECMTFVIKPSGKAEAQTNCHDDEVIALALAVVGIQSYPYTLLRDRQPLKAKPMRSFAEHLYRRS